MAVQDEVPRSRLTLTYKTEVNGEPETVNLPLRLLILGDLSHGSSTDRKVDLDERRLRNLDGKNMSGVMKDMNMSVKVTVPNRVDPDRAENMDVNVPLSSMKSFSPDEIARNVPKLKSLMLMKKLLVEAEANVANTKDFRKLLTDLYASEDAFNKVKEQLKGYDSFKIPGGAGKAGAAAAPAAPAKK